MKLRLNFMHFMDPISKDTTFLMVGQLEYRNNRLFKVTLENTSQLSFWSTAIFSNETDLHLIGYVKKQNCLMRHVDRREHWPIFLGKRAKYCRYCQYVVSTTKLSIDLLYTGFENDIIRRNGHANWGPCSFDLNPLDVGELLRVSAKHPEMYHELSRNPSCYCSHGLC